MGGVNCYVLVVYYGLLLNLFDVVLRMSVC